MNPSPPDQATLDAARQGDAQASYTVYTHYQPYAQAFGLSEAGQYDYLRQAMQAGLPEAQFEVAKLLRGGWLTLSGHTLHPTDQQPTQADLNAAHDLITRAAAQGHERAQAMLHNLGSADWDAATARRSSFGAHAPMLRDPTEQAEERELEAAGQSGVNWLMRIITILAIAVLLWGAWSMYNSRLAEKERSGFHPAIPPAAALHTRNMAGL